MSQQSESLRKRLMNIRARQATAGAFSSSFSTPRRGGLFRQPTIQPIEIGEELALIKESAALCLGQIGTSGSLCLKLASECTTEAHARKKGSLPNDPSLILLKGEDKGYENVVLEAEHLEESLISELLESKDLNWPSEFAKIRSNDSRSIGDREVIEDVLNTAKKQKHFGTPAKKEATDMVMDKISLLESTLELISDASQLQLNVDGEVISNNFAFEKDAHEEFCSSVSDKIDILIENAKCMSDILLSLQPFVQGQIKPIEHLVSGLRIEFASLEALMGNKDLSRKDVPPCIWNAVETGFDSLITVNKKMDELSNTATEAYEVASALLAVEEDGMNKNDKSTNPVSDEGLDGDSFLENLSKPKIINGRLYQPSEAKRTGSSTINPTDAPVASGGTNSGNGGNGNAPHPSGSPNPTSPGCDHDDMLCARCMVKINDLDVRLTSTNVRVSNLEDSKNGNIDSAVMVKDRIYRGRADVAAELDRWFPEANGKKIDAGSFPTPHLILNLMLADMCSRQGPKTPFDQKDLIRAGIRRSDADAFYALQSDKPEFMITKEACPNFTYSVSKSQRDAAAIPFLPTHSDFGNGLESDSLHFKFKHSLEHVQAERESYIESRLGDHPDRRVLAIAKQLLNDSCKFISQMLGFMDEIYASCYESFGATSESWSLVCHCIEEVFTKELKPSLKFSISQDLFDLKDAMIGVVHSAFSLNAKIRELTHVGLKNHHSTTTSHVRFVMKMAKTTRTSESKKSKTVETPVVDAKMQASIATLQKENKELKSYLQRLESRLDSVIAKNDLEVQTKGNSSGSKRSKASPSKDKNDEDAPNKQDK
jgi:hypothetical protein